MLRHLVVPPLGPDMLRTTYLQSMHENRTFLDVSLVGAGASQRTLRHLHRAFRRMK